MPRKDQEDELRKELKKIRKELERYRKEVADGQVLLAKCYKVLSDYKNALENRNHPWRVGYEQT